VLAAAAGSGSCELGSVRVGRVPDVPLFDSGRIGERDALLAMFVVEPWPSGRPLYLGSKLAELRESVGEIALPTTWDTGDTS